MAPGTTYCDVGDADKEKSGNNTVIVRVGGLGSVAPRLSVTVKDAT